MLDTNKENEREELHRAIWSIADELRGAVDGWDFKQFILGAMFYRYISENITNYINKGEVESGNIGFDYATMSDQDAEEAREGLVQEKGFFILPSELFCNVREKAVKGETWTYENGKEKLLNEKLEEVFRHIEESAKGSESESDFVGLFDDFDVNSNKLGSTVTKRNEKLSKLLNGINSMNLGDLKDHSIDTFGDAYEFLMTMYASRAGKSGGEFFTPAEVSELLTRLGTVGKNEINKVYDPACGSGSLLLKAEQILGKDSVRNGFYGQEINITTYNLCRINMFLHDVEFDKFDITCEDTLVSPQHWDDEPFDLIVSNPPYSISWLGNNDSTLINDPRFSPAGVLAPKSRADMAFIMHSLSWLSQNGTAAIVCYPGILYRPGAEQKIRKYLIDNNYIDCVIQLPENLFFGTSIATCIMVMKKNKVDNKTLFINASSECIKVTNNNKLTLDNIEHIVDAFVKREKITNFTYLAAYNEIENNNYDLSVSTYVEAKDFHESIDIGKLNSEIEEIVSREKDLRSEISQILKNTNKANKRHITQTKELNNDISGLFDFSEEVEWKQLKTISKISRGVRVIKKQLIENGEYPVYQNSLAPMGYYDKYNCDRNTTYIISAGAAGEIGFSKSEFWAADDCLTISNLKGVKNKYIYYFLLTKQDYIYANVRKASIPRLSRTIIENIKIPVPSLFEQERIITILDQLDDACTKISQNLNAEIEARQKQYKYYRDMLLDFKK